MNDHLRRAPAAIEEAAADAGGDLVIHLDPDYYTDEDCRRLQQLVDNYDDLDDAGRGELRRYCDAAVARRLHRVAD